MKIVETVPDLLEMRRVLPGAVGFVPTMGYLHEGHLSLVRQAQQENSSVILSIFVNPTQFGPNEDFNNYPRNIERDLNLLKKVNPDIVFIPSKEVMYPADFNSWIEIGDVSQKLEGKCRLGHFKGVCTIVAKLFNIVEPTRAYFGQKDAQQVLVIQKMVADLNMNLEVVVVPTVREDDGLAMSSRNTYLNSEERRAATVLFKSLSEVLDMWRKGAENAEILRQKMIFTVSQEKLASIEYVSIADTKTLDELEIIDRPALVSMAVKIGKTRLIDNIALK